MAQYIFQMRKVRKALGDKVILDDVTLAFIPGAKIGVVGPNGAGKSTVLKMMAGIEHPSNGDAILSPEYSVGILLQEPPLDEDKDVRGNVEDAVAETRRVLAEYEEINEKMAAPDADFDTLLARQAELIDVIEAHDAWELDSRLDQAMDALRLPPGDADVTKLSGGERRRVALCKLLLAAARPAAARRAHQPPRRGVGRLARAAPGQVPGRGAGRHPRPLLPRQRRANGSSSSTGAARTRTKAITPPTWRPSSRG